MKRSALSRRTPLARGKSLERRTKLKPVNRERRAEKFARNFGERAEAVRGMVCLVQVAVTRRRSWSAFLAWVHSASYCSGPFVAMALPSDLADYASPQALGSVVQAAHARARGMSGAKGDRRDLVPLCSKHHAEAGEFRTSQRENFEKRYGLDLCAEARRIAAELDERGLP